MCYLAYPPSIGNNARMLIRTCQNQIADVLSRTPAVVILGPRQVGKTTLALAIAENIDSVYIDLEQPGDLQKLEDHFLVIVRE